MPRTRAKNARVETAAPSAWINRLKYRAFALLVALVLATVATISFVGAPWLPVVGVAVAAACVTIAKLTRSLGHPTCLECGHDLSSQPVSIQGIACPACGSVNSPGLVQLAQMGDPQGSESRDSAES